MYASTPAAMTVSHTGASTGSSRRKTDIPQTDHLTILIIGRSICSKCPWGVSIWDTDILPLCACSQRSIHIPLPTLLVTSLPVLLFPSPQPIKSSTPSISHHHYLLGPPLSSHFCVRIPCRPIHKLDLPLSFLV